MSRRPFCARVKLGPTGAGGVAFASMPGDDVETRVRFDGSARRPRRFRCDDCDNQRDGDCRHARAVRRALENSTTTRRAGK